MGKIQEMEEAAAQWALARATRSELDPVLAELAQLRAEIAQSLTATETQELVRAERLRQTIDPVLQGVQAAVDKIITAISHHSGRLTSLQMDIEILRQDGTVATATALRNQMAHLAQRIADLPDKIAEHVAEAIEHRTTSPGMPSSSGPAQSAAALKRMSEKARAFDLLQARQKSEPAQRLLAQVLEEARGERART
ncbi:hypothetical protein [Roseicella sp. DB1501]|uniref:hypothetical protein n=1 Tax=Roseicella sp. DB1501 TaxID=2730925 RepID=UPI0020C39136|nr:hypothetical protein [Roseicella sp. DB1501]